MSILLNIYLNHNKNSPELWKTIRTINGNEALKNAVGALLKFYNLRHYGRETRYQPWQYRGPDEYERFSQEFDRGGDFCSVLENSGLTLSVGKAGLVIDFIDYRMDFIVKVAPLQQLLRGVARQMGIAFGATDALYFADSGPLTPVGDWVRAGRDWPFISSQIMRNGARKARNLTGIRLTTGDFYDLDGYFHEKIPRTAI